MSKGISLQEMSGIALAFVITAIVIGIVATILSQTIQQQCSTTVSGGGYNAATGLCFANSTTVASNATTYGVTGIGTLGAWLPTISVIVAAAVVIGIILVYFRGA